VSTALGVAAIWQSAHGIPARTCRRRRATPSQRLRALPTSQDWHDDDCHAQADDEAGHDEADHDEADHEEQLLAGSISHFHLTFLGLSLCIPGEDVPHDHDSENPSVESLLLVNEPFAGNNGPSAATRYDYPSQTFLTLPVRPEREQLAKRPPPVASPPLCDVARHELTGVLLI